MRTAVCISGQPKDFAETWMSIVDNLLVKLPGPDVFIHSSAAYPDDTDWRRLMRPKKYVIEEQYPFPELEAKLDRLNYYAKHHANSYLQQIFGFKRVWAIKKEYEAEAGVRYDFAIRCRPDLLFLRPIQLDFFDLNKINVFDPPDYMGIEFAFGKDDLMASYMNVFDWLCGEGEERLLADTRRRDVNDYGFYNCDLIQRAYLLDNLKLPVRQILVGGQGQNPYDYYRIMYLHKQGQYDQ